VKQLILGHAYDEYSIWVLKLCMIEVEGIDREDINMVEMEVVEREYEGVVLVMHLINDRAERHQ
jgi:hypothetical protein